jgi:predicted amidohydrolase YtcJ
MWMEGGGAVLDPSPAIIFHRFLSLLFAAGLRCRCKYNNIAIRYMHDLPMHDLRVVSGVIASATPAESPRLFIDGRELELPRGAVILPGLVDTHCHLIGLGLMGSRVGLRGARSAGECARRVAASAAGRGAGEWITGFGWNQEEWETKGMPSRADLDAVIPDHPVVLYRIDSHALWLNSAALHAAGIGPRQMEGGSIETDAEGRPTGILIDNAMKLAEAVIPPPTVEQQQRWIEQGVDRCIELGITGVHDMNVEPERIESMVRAAERGRMRLRCQVFLAGQEDEWRAFPAPGPLAPNLEIVGVKYFADGALGSRGALLLEPYSDAPGALGLQLLDADRLEGLATEPVARGFAVATHAIGDAANRIVLDAYERLRARHPAALLRIEHAQNVDPADLPRFASLGVIPAVQAIHCTSDAPMAEARLGDERCAHAYPWASLASLGVSLLGGSDFPIESADPLAGLRAFHFRRPDGAREPWHPEQAISRRAALDAYTAAAPLGVPGSLRRGRLLPGYDADLTILDGDPFDESTRVLMTVVGGAVAGR